MKGKGSYSDLATLITSVASSSQHAPSIHSPPFLTSSILPLLSHKPNFKLKPSSSLPTIILTSAIVPFFTYNHPAESKLQPRPKFPTAILYLLSHIRPAPSPPHPSETIPRPQHQTSTSQETQTKSTWRTVLASNGSRRRRYDGWNYPAALYAEFGFRSRWEGGED